MDTGAWKTTGSRTSGMAIGMALGIIIVFVIEQSQVVPQVPNEVAVAIGSVCSWLVDWINPRT